MSRCIPLIWALLTCVALADPLQPLRENCLACHGGITKGKKVIKGDFSIEALLKDGIQERHSGDWVKVVELIRDGEMPPDDSDYSLSDAQGQAVIDSVFAKLDQSELGERLLTPFEIANTAAQLFGLDLEVYDPFEGLYFQENIDASYPTVDSNALMSPAYLRQIEAGLDLTLARTVANGFLAQIGNPKKLAGITEFELGFVRTFVSDQRDPAVYQAYLLQTPTLPHSKEAIYALNDKEKEAVLKQENKQAEQAFWQHIQESEDMDLVQIRKRGPTRLFCKEYGINLPPGKYRFQFSARALHRSLVSEVARSWDGKNPKMGVGTFRELLHAKAVLAIRHNGINAGRRGQLVANSHSGKRLHHFEIEDDVAREYVCEFELTTPGMIEIDFVNGPTFERLNRLNLGETSAKVFEPDNYPLPHIAIDSKLLLTKLGPPSPYSPYQLADDSAEDLQAKLLAAISALSLEAHAAELLAVQSRLDAALSPAQKYVETLKWITMSERQLYLSWGRDDPASRARYLSYAFLKTPPSASFKDDLERFEAGTISSHDFARKLIADPGFEDFLAIFTTHWLENRTKLDARKFAEIDLGLPFAQETTDYLLHLFRDNRPVAEFFHSDYRILTADMASYYGLSEPGLPRYQPRKVKALAGGGLLHQANFFVARSDGVDPRPFSRAKWIVENALGREIRDPPGNIDAEEFARSSESKTFEERTLAHREMKSCRSCHEALDPVAFAIKDYDTIGRMTGSANTEAKRELGARLAQAHEAMAHAFTRNLITYAIGRDSNIHDVKAIDMIVANTAENGNGATDILAAIIDHYFHH